MVHGLLGMEIDVGAAHDHGQARPPEVRGHVVGPARVHGPGGDGHQVRPGGEVQALGHLVHERDPPVRRDQGGQIGQGQRHEPAPLHPHRGAVLPGAVHAGLDDEQVPGHGLRMRQ